MSNKSFMAVDSDKLRKELREHHDFFVNAYGGFSNLPPKEKARVDEITQCIARVINLRPVEAVAVVHGRWIENPDNQNQVYCSHCNMILEGIAIGFYYCPNCGAKMDGGNEDG